MTQTTPHQDSYLAQKYSQGKKAYFTTDPFPESPLPVVGLYGFALTLLLAFFLGFSIPDAIPILIVSGMCWFLTTTIIHVLLFIIGNFYVRGISTTLTLAGVSLGGVILLIGTALFVIGGWMLVVIPLIPLLKSAPRALTPFIIVGVCLFAGGWCSATIKRTPL